MNVCFVAMLSLLLLYILSLECHAMVEGRIKVLKN